MNLPPGFVLEEEQPKGINLPPGFVLEDQAPVESGIASIPIEPKGGFIPAVQRGFLQTGILLGDILPAMVGRAIGADEYAERQFKEAAETEKKIQEKYAPAVASYKDIKGVGDAVTYAVESVGELIPSILPSLFTGGVAGVVGRGAVIAAREAAETAARKQIAEKGLQAITEKEVMDQIRKAGVDAASKTALKYQTVGAVTGSATQNIPEVYQNIKEETEQESLGAALLFGGFNSLLDAALPLSLMIKARKAGIPGEEIVGEWYKRFGKGAAKGFATEGATEAAQEMSSAAAEKFVDQNKDFFSERNLERFINAGLKGGLGGGVVSGATDVMLGKKSLTEENKPLDQDIRDAQTDILARRALLDELRAQAAEEGKNKLDADSLKDLGFGTKYSLYDSLLNKDINDPAQAAEVVNILQTAVQDPATKGRERVVAANTLEVINQYLETRGEPDVGQVVEEPSGAGIPVPTEPVAPAPAEGVAGVERTGVVPPVADVGAPVGGERLAAAPVAPVETVEAVQPETAPAPEVAAQPAPEPVVPTTRELITEQETQLAKDMERFQNLLQQQVRRFGLNDVAVQVDADLREADGQYTKGLIKLAVDAADPVRALRHESIHAMKELGFFTPSQWNALVNRANESWINTYLQNRNVDGGFIEPGQTSRYDAYLKLFKDQGLNEAQAQEALIEEAISDAFGDFSQTQAPPGMMRAILNRMKNFFKAIKETVSGSGVTDPERLFGKIEKGEVAAPLKPVSEVAAPPEQKTEAPKAEAPTAKSSLRREAVKGEMEISTQNPQAVGRKYDPITQMLSVDEAAVREAMKENPDLKNRVIQAIKSYGFIPEGTPNKDVIDVFKKNIVNNLLYLYRAVPSEIGNRSRLWYDGANVIANQMAGRYNLSPQQVSAIMAAMSPQKDWFQNVSMAERAIDILTYQGESSWTPEMLRYAESYVNETRDRKEREKRQQGFKGILKTYDAGTKLKDMSDEDAAAFIRAYDESFNSRKYRIVTPEGGFGDWVRNNDGTESTLMWSTYGPIEKSVSIFRDGSRENISQQLGFEHKIRSFYNNIVAPNSDLDHVTIDTHAVAAGLFEALAGTDPEVAHNFGATGKSDVIGIGGTYGIIADAYRDAAKQVGIKPREMQSITWEAIRALFSEEMKRAIKPMIRAEWQKYKTGQQSFDDTRQRVLEIATKYKGPGKEIEFDNRTVDIPPPDWVGSGRGMTVEEGGHSYDKAYVPEGGVRLREYNELREKMTFNLSAVTSSIPGLRELYERAMRGKQDAYELLQKVAESSLNHYLTDSGARVNIDYAKGVFLSDREPSISVSVSFDERNSKKVLAALAQFADNYNQQQIHVRVPTAQKVGHQFEDDSYATPVYEIDLRKGLSNKAISRIINDTGLQGFTVTDDKLTAYWLAPTDATEQQLKEDFNAFANSVKAANELVGERGSNPRRRVERLYVYGTGYGARLDYSRIRSDIPAKRPADTETPRLIAQYLTGEPVKAFKQKELTAAQKKDQELLARVYEDLPLNDLKRPIVKRAYDALSKALVEQYKVLPIKVELIDSTEEPYRNSAEMRRDVSENNRFKVYKTQPDTFGPPGSNFKNHPLLKDSGLKDISGQPMLFNDLLRAVHDYFAHNITEAQFGPLGEAAAWRNHMATTPDPMARWALTAETRLQNAWQNFRRGAQDLTLMQRGFADQKAALPPLNFVLTGDRTVDAPVVALIKELPGDMRLGSLPPQSAEASSIKKTIQKIVDTKTPEEVTPPKYSISGKRITDTPELREAARQSAIVDAQGNLIPMYHGTGALIRIFRPKQAGATFVSPDPGFASGFTSASRRWMVRHIGQFLKPEEIRKGIQELRQAIYSEYGKQSKMTSKIMDEIHDVLLDAKETGVYNFKGELEDKWYDIAFNMIPGAKERVMELYVLAKKPFDFENKADVNKIIKQLMTDPAIKAMYGYDAMPGVDIFKPENFMLRQTLERSDKDYKAAVEAKFKDNLSRGSWTAIETPEVQKAIKALDFDSFYVVEGGVKNLGVYDPKLIKSADENVGPFGQRPPTEEEAAQVGMEPSEALKAQEEGDIRFSLRAHKDLFDRADEIPMSEGVEAIRDDWVGGVAGVGNRDSMYELFRIEGGPAYTGEVQKFLRNNLGENFKGYRLMSQGEFEELTTGSMGSQFVSFSLNPDVAKGFKNLPAYAKRKDLVVVEMDLTPEHVHMIGHPGEQELVVDYGQGYNPAEIKVVEGDVALKSLRAPDTEAFKKWFGDSKVVDEDGEPMVMYHGTTADFDVFDTTRRAIAGEGSFFSSSPMGSFAAGVGGNIMPVYLSIKNPKVIDLARESDDVFKDRFIKQGHDGVVMMFEGKIQTAVAFYPEQIKSATGNIGTFEPTSPDIRFSLRSKPFDPDSLPTNNKEYTLPQNTILYHGAYETIADAIQSVGYLTSRPKIKAHGGLTNEGGLVWFGSKETAQKYADSEADPGKVRFDREAGIIREPGKVFEAITDQPYKLISRYKVLSAKEANALNEALGLPDYKRLKAGDGADTAAYRANDYKASKAERFEIQSGKYTQTISSPWPIILKTLNADGFYSDGTVALTAENGIRLSEEGKPMERFSLRSQIDPAINARIVQTTTAREEKSFPQRITQAIGPESWSRFRAAALNRYNRLGEYDKMRIKQMGGADLLADSNAESAALMSDLSAGIVAGSLGVYDKVGGVPVYNHHYVVERTVQTPTGPRTIVVGGKISNRNTAEALARRYPNSKVKERGYTAVSNLNNTIKGPIAIFAPLAKLGDPYAYQAYQYWAGVKRGSKWVTQTQGPQKGQVVEQLFNDPTDISKAEELRKKFLNDYKIDFNQIQKEWIDYNDQLVQYMLDTGVISRENAKKFKDHGDYIPFYRQINGDDDAVGPRVFQSIAAVKAPRKIKGGEDPLGDFLENVVRNTQAAVQAGLKNVAARRAADVGMDLGFVSRVNQAQADPVNSFYVMENGQKIFYDSSDPLLIDSIKSLGLSEFPGIGLLAGPAGVLRNLVTKDPGFMLANMMRDSLAAWTTSGVNMLPVAATLKNFTEALAGTSPEFKALLMSGVVGGYDYSQGTVDAAKQFGKELRKTAGARTIGEKAMSPFTSLWEGLEKGTQASDAATRIEVYKQTLRETGNEAEAMFRALEVMNFNRKGNNPIVRVATAAIPFLNARMQGLDVLYRAGLGKNATANAQEIQKAFWRRGMYMAALSTMYWALTHDDDEYKKQEQETKDNNWLFPSAGVRVPIPFEVGVLFKVIPERIAALVFGDDSAKDFTASMVRNLTSTLAVNPIPQTLLPLVEATANFSFFTFRPIVGQGLEGVAAPYQIGPSTSRAGQLLAEMTKGMPSALQISPMKADAIIQGYTGTIGSYMSQLFDAVYDMHTDNPKASLRFEQLPVVKRFILDPDARGQVTAYFDLKNSVDEATRTANLLERSMNYKEWGEYYTQNIGLFAVKDYILDMDKTLKEYRDMKNMVRSMPMDADQKRDSILAITRIENQLNANIQILKKQAGK